jgi:hypothetical protein
VALEKIAGNADAGFGVAFLVSAGIVAELIAKACSSPQTTELNAGSRAPTLMKWVNVGALESILFVSAAALFDPRHRVPIILGGAAELAITYAEYLHARSAGLASDLPGTEEHSGGGQVAAAAGTGVKWGWAA